MTAIMTESFMAMVGTVLDLFKKPVETMSVVLFDFMFKGMNTSFANALYNPLLEAIATIFSWFSWAILIACIPVYLVKVVFEEKRDWMVILRCFIMTLMFIYLNQHIAKLCFYVPSIIVTMFGYIEHTASWEGLVSLANPLANTGTLGPLLIVVVVVALAAFFIASMMRVGAIYTQMMVAPFYVPYVLMGDNQKTMEWILTTVAMSVTYIIQYALFYIGMVIMQYAPDFMTSVIGLGLVLSTFSVPQILQKFGFSSGAGRGFQSMSMPVTSIVSTLLRKK